MNRTALAVPVVAAAALAAWQFLPDGGDVPPEPVLPYSDAARGDGWFDDSWSPGVDSKNPFDPSGVLSDIVDPEGADEDDDDAVGEGDDEDDPAQSTESAASAPAPPASSTPASTTTTTVAVLTIEDGADVPEIDDLPAGDR